MGKVKIKRKSTLIDMTAMSDVTVLLLTFFMLTSTFVQKEPIQVQTPSSVSVEDVKKENVASILVGKDGEVFLSVVGSADTTSADASTSAVRQQILRNAVESYEKQSGKKANITEGDIAKFAKTAVIGVPIKGLHEYLQLTPDQQEKFLESAEGSKGIPFTQIGSGENATNEFQIWMRAVYNANEDFKSALKSGEGIAVKADKTTPYSTVHKVLDNLQTLKMNRFNVMTVLKTEEE